MEKDATSLAVPSSVCFVHFFKTNNTIIGPPIYEVGLRDPISDDELFFFLFLLDFFLQGLGKGGWENHVSEKCFLLFLLVILFHVFLISLIHDDV